MKKVSPLLYFAAGMLAFVSTGCTITGSGTIPSAVDPNQDMTFSIDVEFTETEGEGQGYTGTATFVDCAANINATSTLTFEDAEACNEALSDVEGLNSDTFEQELLDCLGITGEFDTDSLFSFVIGRYELTDECLQRCKQRRRCGRGYGNNRYSYSRGRSRGRCRGSQRRCARRRARCENTEPEVIGTGCMIAVYADCEAEDGDMTDCTGDGVAVYMVDDSDPTQLFYKNCGVLTSGEVEITTESTDGSGNVVIDNNGGFTVITTTEFGG